MFKRPILVAELRSGVIVLDLHLPSTASEGAQPVRLRLARKAHGWELKDDAGDSMTCMTRSVALEEALRWVTVCSAGGETV